MQTEYPDEASGAVQDDLVSVGPSGIDAAPPNPLTQIHSLLRGRYWIAVPLALIGLVAGSLVGYRVTEPIYKSTGAIRVKPVLPRVLYQNEQNNVMPMFDSYMESQASLVGGQRVSDQAMQDPEWQGLGRGLDPKVVAQFRKSLEVSHPRGSELVIVEFNDADPRAAMIAVRSTIDAYRKIYGDTDADNSQRVQALEDRKLKLSNELKSYKDRLDGLTKNYGSSSLQQAYEYKQEELNRTESKLKDTQLAMLEVGSLTPTTKPATAAPATPESVALYLPQMRRNLDTKHDLQIKLANDIRRLGEKHQTVVEDQTMLEQIDADIEQLLDSVLKGEIPGVAALNTPPSVMTLEQLKVNEGILTKMYAKEKQELLELGQKSAELKSLQEDVEAAKDRLEETRKRLEQLDLEATIGGRLTVVSQGDKPLQPDKDRRMAFAAAGGLGLAGLGFGSVLLFGLITRTVRHIDDARRVTPSAHRLLGVLPCLPRDLADPDQVTIAAHSVHQIRGLLQLGHPTDACPCVAVTSPSPGSGKTSLSIALGLSFAASGSKTLLIDCDLIGGGLTSAVSKIRKRRIGYILVQKGLIKEADVERIKELAKRARLRFGEAAVKLGLITSEDVVNAVETQSRSPVGLREALAGEALQNCVMNSGIPGLFLLPLGSARREHAGQLSPAAIEKLMTTARKYFHAIVIDTGPILGSFEASVVTAAADETVLTFSRGESRTLIEQSVNRLNELGATFAGVVFNRANDADIMQSGFSSSVSRASRAEPQEPKLLLSMTDRGIRLGPVAEAVAALTESANAS